MVSIDLSEMELDSIAVAEFGLSDMTIQFSGGDLDLSLSDDQARKLFEALREVFDPAGESSRQKTVENA